MTHEDAQAIVTALGEIYSGLLGICICVGGLSLVIALGNLWRKQ